MPIERLLDRATLEQAVRHGHSERMINRGDADWLVEGLLPDGRHFGVVYDHPHGADHAAVRIVSVMGLLRMISLSWRHHGIASAL